MIELGTEILPQHGESSPILLQELWVDLVNFSFGVYAEQHETIFEHFFCHWRRKTNRLRRILRASLSPH